MKNFQIFRNVVQKDKVTPVLNYLKSEANKQYELMKAVKESQSLSSLDEVNFSKISDAQRKMVTGHFPPEIRLHQSILNLGSSKDIIETVQTYTGWNEVYLHLPPMARFVIPDNSNAKVPIHQDIAYNKHLSEFVTVWIPLVSIDKNCGGVKCAHDPGFAVEDPGVKDNGIWLEGLNKQNFEFQECVPMEPGDLLLFTKTTIHGSMENLSDRTRFSLDLRYFPSNIHSSKHYLDPKKGVIHAPK